MEPRSAQRVLIAVDTNVLLELADEVEDVVEAFHSHERLPLALQALDLPTPIIATPCELVRKFLPR